MDGAEVVMEQTGQTSFITGRCVLSREVRASAPVRPMDGVLSDMRALVTTTRRLVRGRGGRGHPAGSGLRSRGRARRILRDRFRDAVR